MKTKPRFDAAKEFSDFLGFHVRAVFCLTLAFVALYPLYNDFFVELLTRGEREVARTGLSYWASVLSTATLLVFFVAIVVHIFRTAFEFLRRRVSYRWVRVMLVIPLGVAEFSALLAIPLFVFVQVPVFSDSFGGGAIPQQVRVCLIDEFVQRNGIAMGEPPRPECNALLEAARSSLLEADEVQNDE